jgi:repressor LexA
MLRRKGFLDHDGAAHGLRLAPTGMPLPAGEPSAARVTDGVQESGGSGGGRRGGGDGVDEGASWGFDIPGMQVVVPLLGTIAAGKPLEAVERSDEYVPIPASLARGSAFVLRVAGESMVEDAILDGDLVVVQACDRVEDGAVAVVLLGDGCATLKRVYAEKDGLRLQPANRSMKPILAREARIRGRVVGLIRQFE